MAKNLLFLIGCTLCILQSQSQLPNCPQQPGQIPNFSGTPSQVNPANLNQVISNDGTYSVGEVFRYTNAVTIPANINAYIYIEAARNATIQTFDNNGAGLSARFQPTIRPNPVNLTTATQEGWVQFRIEFRYSGGSMAGQLVNLAPGLQYRHFDIDGYTNGSTGYFRETGWTTGQSGAYFIAPTSLTNGGSITDGGPPDPTKWIEILGQTSEHNGPSSDPNVTYTSQFGPVNTVRFRMGYQFVKGNGGNITNQVAREYAVEFGCFDLTNNIILPVKLESFSGVYKNERVKLNWTTSSEVNFSRFEVERSSNGIDYTEAGIVFGDGNSSLSTKYEFPDDLSPINSNIIYYRLKMVDDNETFSYSPVVVIRKETNISGGLSVFPNPSSGNSIQLRLSSDSKGGINIKVYDLNGKIVSKQVQSISDGNNSITIKLPGLNNGVYIMQVTGRQHTQNLKFTILR
ncbi:MAG: T9SS type A sorting domain-containing protein [Bacteroidetes bacterium]|nr:T9SS type A sorting domain-containing protein [Bacteroidota bacterium]